VSPILVALERIGKSFPGVRALDGVTFDVRAGECHALVGENGAGKSTLLKILGGAIPWPGYEGSLHVGGHERRFSGVRDAEAAGIAVVHQELSVVGPLSAAENIALGHEPHRVGVIARDAVRSRAHELLASLRVAIDVDAPVERLGVGQQQFVEIAKALGRDARVLVLDEPTAALTDADAGVLLERLRQLKERGLGIVYVSHRLDEVFRIADRITVLRDGRTVDTRAVDRFDEGGLVAAMVGRTVETLFPPAGRPPGDVRLAIRHVSVADPARHSRRLVDDVSFEVRKGEVLGIAGLMGAGRTTLLTSLFGAPPGPMQGAVAIDGVPVEVRSPGDAIRQGLALLTEDRKRLGLLLDESVAMNVTLASLKDHARGPLLDSTAEGAATADAIRTLGIRAGSGEVPAGTLSGGNQQKVLVGRWLWTAPRVLLLDEPTRGVDVGARQEIYALVDRLARDGLAVVLVSSDLTELLGLADRVLVLRAGRLVAEFPRATATPEAVMAAATGTAIDP
jgi:D-xylose transport system ATP-binding protein